MSVPLYKSILNPDRATGYEIKQPFCPLAFPLFSVCVPFPPAHWLCLQGAFSRPCVAGLEMDVWPLGAAGREQHWSCQTGWGGCIRSSSPSSGVNRRSGTFTQPLTYVVTSEVMIKVRGQPGPLWSGSSQAPPAVSSSFSLYVLSPQFFFPCSFPHLLSVCLSLTLSFTGRDQLRHPHPLGEQKGKQEKINREDEWRPGGPIKNWMPLSVLVWFTHTPKLIQIDSGITSHKQEGRSKHGLGKCTKLEKKMG